ncbi:MAG: RdgB/HAM1 family non-canonical purine NTP pyrophosphatase [Rikenellaceae bacterium]
MKLIFATNNAHKLAEVSATLGAEYQLVTPRECGIIEDIPETSDTLSGNALQKARYLKAKTGLDCFADDTGLEVEALGGAPGVRSARYATDGHDFEANNRLLLKNLEGCENRRARFRTVIALIEGDKETLFEGIVEGEITTQHSGARGFGYDPIFAPEGSPITFAQMPLEQKNQISHRGRAVKKLVDYLRRK